MILAQRAHALNPWVMSKRTSPRDATQVVEAADLEEIVQDKRAVWRATDAKARRRQRRYKRLLTRELLKGGAADFDDGFDGDSGGESDGKPEGDDAA